MAAIFGSEKKVQKAKSEEEDSLSGILSSAGNAALLQMMDGSEDSVQDIVYEDHYETDFDSGEEAEKEGDGTPKNRG